MRYRLLCCSDTHGHAPPRPDEAGAVAWLHAGDINHGPTAVADGSDPARDPLRAPAARWFTERTIPILAVPGNHDGVDDLRAFRAARDVDGLVVPVAPRLFVAGVGWHGQRYYEMPFEADLAKACDSVRRQALRLLSRDDRLILLSHYPPRFAGTREVVGDADGAGVWYDCIRRLVEELHPLAVVQGHVHKWFQTATTVDVDSRKVLTLSPGPSGAILTVDVHAGTAKHEWIID